MSHAHTNPVPTQPLRQRGRWFWRLVGRMSVENGWSIPRSECDATDVEIAEAEAAGLVRMHSVLPLRTGFIMLQVTPKGRAYLRSLPNVGG